MESYLNENIKGLVICDLREITNSSLIKDFIHILHEESQYPSLFLIQQNSTTFKLFSPRIRHALKDEEQIDIIDISATILSLFGVGINFNNQGII